MNNFLKEFVKTYGPKIEAFILAAIIAGFNAVLIAITDGKPDAGLLALINIFGVGMLDYATSHGRNLVAKDVKAQADAKVMAVLVPPDGHTDY